jgi:hypothetical protein
VKIGDVICYMRDRRKPQEDPETYAFAGIILDVFEDRDGITYKVFWSDYQNFDLVPVELLEEYYEVIHETW